LQVEQRNGGINAQQPQQMSKIRQHAYYAEDGSMQSASQEAAEVSHGSIDKSQRARFSKPGDSKGSAENNRSRGSAGAAERAGAGADDSVASNDVGRHAQHMV